MLNKSLPIRLITKMLELSDNLKERINKLLKGDIIRTKILKCR